jgi:hypothetical protein
LQYFNMRSTWCQTHPGHSSRTVFHNCFPPLAHPNLFGHMTANHKISPYEKKDTKIYMAINLYPHVNTCPISVQAYENKTQHMLNKTTDDIAVAHRLRNIGLECHMNSAISLHFHLCCTPCMPVQKVFMPKGHFLMQIFSLGLSSTQPS